LTCRPLIVLIEMPIHRFLMPGAQGTTSGWVHSLTNSRPAPAPLRSTGSVGLIDVVDFASDDGGVAKLGEHTVRRGTKHNVAGVNTIGNREDLGAVGSVPRHSAGALSGQWGLAFIPKNVTEMR
jgi:hypothetical protein